MNGPPAHQCLSEACRLDFQMLKFYQLFYTQTHYPSETKGRKKVKSVMSVATLTLSQKINTVKKYVLQILHVSPSINNLSLLEREDLPITISEQQTSELDVIF